MSGHVLRDTLGRWSEEDTLTLWRAFSELEAAARLQYRLSLPTIREIKALVGARFDVDPPAFDTSARVRSIARPRQVAMSLAHQLTGRSKCDVGRAFRRTSWTVLHAIRQIERLRAEDRAFDACVRALADELSGHVCDDPTQFAADASRSPFGDASQLGA